MDVLDEDSCDTKSKGACLAADKPCSPQDGQTPTSAVPLSSDTALPQKHVPTNHSDEDSTTHPPEFPKSPCGSPRSEVSTRWTHLTEFELQGLQALVEKLEALPENKRCVPSNIEDPHALLEHMKVRGHTPPLAFKSGDRPM